MKEAVKVALVPLHKVVEDDVIDMVGEVDKQKPAKVAVPKGVVTLTIPLAPLPTTAVMVLLFTTVKLVATTAPKLTSVAPVNPEPMIVTVEPVKAIDGVKDVMVGRQGVIVFVIKLPMLMIPLPTEIVEDTLLVAVLITLTELLPQFATYTFVPS